MIEIKEAYTGTEYMGSYEEQDKAEKTFNDNIVLKAKTRGHNHSFYIMLIPYIDYANKFFNNEDIQEEDIFLYIKETCFATRKGHFVDTDVVYFDLNKIPLQYNYFDVFVYSTASIGKTYMKEITFSMQEEDMLYKPLFSYKKQFDKFLFGVNVGTFGKVDDGWKFYPSFKEALVEDYKILKLYLGKDYGENL